MAKYKKGNDELDAIQFNGANKIEIISFSEGLFNHPTENSILSRDGQSHVYLNDYVIKRNDTFSVLSKDRFDELGVSKVEPKQDKEPEKTKKKK